MAENYEHVSFWVLEVISGKIEAQKYYTGKGNTMRSSGSLPRTSIVRIIAAPSVVRPNGVYRNGVKIEEHPAFLNRADEGKKAILMTQNANGKENESLVIPTITSEGFLQQLLITDPKYYKIEKCPVMDWGEGIPKCSKEDILKGMELQAWCVDTVAHMMEEDGFTIDSVNDKYRPTQVFASKAGKQYDVIVAGEVMPYKGKIPYDMKRRFSSFCKERGSIPMFASVSIMSDDLERAAAELALKYDGYRVFRNMEELSDVKEPRIGENEYYEYLVEKLSDAIKSGCFDRVYDSFDEGIIYRSQWKGALCAGKVSMLEYLNRTDSTARNNGVSIATTVVALTRKHEVKDLLRMMDEKPVLGILLRQEIKQSIRWLLLLPRFNNNSQITEIYLCDPARYSFKYFFTFE